MQKKIQYFNRLYLFVSQVNRLIIRSSNVETLFDEFCRIAVDTGNFQMSWIGKLDETTNNVIPVSFAGHERDYLSTIRKITLDDSRPEGHGPVASSIREGRQMICYDIETDPIMAPWRADALARNYRSLMAIPIRCFGKIFGAVMFYSAIKNYFDDEEVKLLQEVTDNITFQMENFEKEAVTKRVEEDLFQSENRYRVMTETSPVGIFHSNVDGDTTYVNQKWCKITGIPFDDAMGARWIKAVHPEDKDFVLESWYDALNFKKQTSVEYRIVRPDGSISYVIGEVIPEIDFKNEVVGYIGTITDITEIKKRKKQLQNYRFALDQSSIVDVSDSRGHILYANENFCQISGYSLEELINQDHRLLNSGYHDEEFISYLWNTINSGKVWKNEIRNKAKDGSLFWTETTIIPFLNDDGKPFQFIAIRSDITKRKEAEELLIESEERYRGLSEATFEAIFLSERGICIGQNLSARNMFGYSDEEAIGRYGTEWIIEEDRDMVMKNMLNGYSEPYQATALKKDGTTFPCLLHGKMMYYRGRNVRITSLTDITLRKRSEDALRESEAKYRELVENSPDSIVIYQNGKILFANNECVRLLQVNSMSDLIGKSVMQFVHPDFHEFVSKRMSQILRTKKILPMAEEKLIRMDGTEVEVEVKAVPINFIGKPAIQLIIHDTTDRKVAEKRYRDLFNLSPQPIWLVDLNTLKFIQVNQAAVENYGYSENEFMGMTIMDIRPKGQIDVTNEYLHKHFTDTYVRHAGNFVHRKKSGDLIDVEIYSTSILSNGNKLGLVIAIDVTEKNQHAHEIMKAIIKAQEDERYEIGGELHDNISQILAACKMNLEMIERTIEPSKKDWINKCIEYITTSIEEIRNLSHRLAPVFLNDITLREAFTSLLTNMNIDNKYRFVLSFDAAVSKKTVTHELQLTLYRILQEQLKNILKYSRASLIEVDVHIKKNILFLRISDNGIGFDVSKAKKGIGLANIQRRVESFFGTFILKSSPGNGCIILIDIPLKN